MTTQPDGDRAGSAGDMNATTIFAPRLGYTIRRTAALALAAATAVLGLTACQRADSGLSEASSADKNDNAAADLHAPRGQGKDTKPQRLLWMGDSIGEAEAPALGAAMRAGNVEFKSVAAAGGGGVVGAIAASTWKSLPKELTSFKPDVVAYQLTTYDWGTPEEQTAAYEKLAKTVIDAGAELLIVSAPPFKLGDFYKPHEAELKTAPKSAQEVADKYKDTVHYLDAATLWGTDASAARAQRSTDGIHSCQQGSAAFADWFGERLQSQYGYTPAAPDKWATGSWTSEKVYDLLACE